MMTVAKIMTVPKKKAGEFLKLFCHDQVKILLERMDSHPEEFTSKEKWDLFLPTQRKAQPIVRLVSLYEYFTTIERFAIKTKINELVHEKMRQEAYNGIMDTLVKSEYKDIESMFSSAAMKAGGSTITYTSGARLLQDHLDAHKKALAK
ncbi:MAG: hypothetical protein WCK82_05320 [Bacteroidota bacterium]